MFSSFATPAGTFGAPSAGGLSFGGGGGFGSAPAFGGGSFGLSDEAKTAELPAAPASAGTQVAAAAAPEDTVSEMQWRAGQGGALPLVLAASWDSAVRLWALASPDGALVPSALLRHEAPVLGARFFEDMVATASADRTVRLWDLDTERVTALGAHEAAATRVLPLLRSGTVVSAGLDNALRVWDPRQRGEVAGWAPPDGAGLAAVDAHPNHSRVAVALQDGTMGVWDPRSPGALLDQRAPVLRAPILATCVIGADGEWPVSACGSVEGRVAISYFNSSPKSFAFKCHRENGLTNEIFAVNVVARNPVKETNFCTGGSDGTLVFWDYQTKQRKHQGDRLGAAVTAAAYSADASHVAYATGYDWRHGARGRAGAPKPRVFVLKVEDKMV